MQIRRIHPEEVDQFLTTATRPENEADVRAYLQRLLAGGHTQIPWCWVAEENGEFVGRMAYWTLPSVGKPTDFILLDLPWDGDYLAIGTALLGESAKAMREEGADDLMHIVDVPARVPQWQHSPEARHELLTANNFHIIRETRRFMWDGSAPIPPESGRLTYRDLNEVGEEAFTKTIELLSRDSLDQRDQEDAAEYGPEEAARKFFRDLQDLEYQPEWWKLAYDEAGELVGLVAPCKLRAELGTIGYIGVVPGQRGKGYIHDLLSQGVTAVVMAGATEMVNDTDKSNAPMAAAFLRAGHQEFGMRKEYRQRAGSPQAS